MNDSLEFLWGSLLSRDPERIRKAFSYLDLESRTSVMQHLGRMANDPGWLAVQQQAAQIALQTLLEEKYSAQLPEE